MQTKSIAGYISAAIASFTLGACAYAAPDATVQVGLASSISGRILYSGTSKPVAGMLVKAVESSGQQWMATTDKNGAYTISKLPAGKYIMEALDYQQVFKDWVEPTQTVDVASGIQYPNINIILIHGAIVKGKVTDKATGRPIGNILVSASPQNEPPGQGGGPYATTYADGSYSLHILPGTTSVFLSTPSYARIDSDPQTISAAEGDTKTLNFKVDAPIVPITVHGVVCGPDGHPVPGAFVTANDLYVPSKTVTTDSNGHFTMDAPGLNPSAMLKARAGDLATASPYIFNGENTEITLRLVAGALCTVTGYIKDSDGKPIQNSQVNLLEFEKYSQTTVASTKSNAQGQYAFPPAFGDTTYAVETISPGYTTGNSNRITATAGQTIDMPTIIMKDASSFVEGTVVNAGGKPVANATVSDNDVRINSVTTDNTGHFLIKGVPQGKTTVMVTFDNNIVFPFPQQLNSGADSSGNIISIPSPVNGVVLGPNGKPVPGAEVIASIKGQGSKTVNADNDGHFTIDSPGLTTKDNIVARSGSLSTANPYYYKGEDTVTLHLTAGNLSAITGQVKNADGNPISSADVTLVRFVNNTGSDLSHTQTDASGNYAFPPCYGNSQYMVSATATGYGTANSQQTNVGAGQTTKIAAITLTLADSFVGGTVVNSKGTPIANATVRDQDVNNLETTTDNAGHFTLKNVPRGKTNLWVNTNDGGYGSLDAISGEGYNVIIINK